MEPKKKNWRAARGYFLSVISCLIFSTLWILHVVDGTYDGYRSVVSWCFAVGFPLLGIIHLICGIRALRKPTEEK